MVEGGGGIELDAFSADKIRVQSDRYKATCKKAQGARTMQIIRHSSFKQWFIYSLNLYCHMRERKWMNEDERGEGVEARVQQYLKVKSSLPLLPDL